MSQHLSSKSKLKDVPLRNESVNEASSEEGSHRTSAAGFSSPEQPEAGLIQGEGLSSELLRMNQVPRLKKAKVKAARPSPRDKSPLRLTGSHAHYKAHLKSGFQLAPLPLAGEGPQLKSKSRLSKGGQDGGASRQSLPSIPQRGQSKALACLAQSVVVKARHQGSRNADLLHTRNLTHAEGGEAPFFSDLLSSKRSPRPTVRLKDHLASDDRSFQLNLSLSRIL